MKKTVKINPFLKSLIALVFWCGVWWIVSLIVDREVLIPSPWDTAVHLCELVKTADFGLSVLFSVLRVTLGFTVSVLLGAVTGILSAKIKTADTLISPLMSVIKATPVASFIILALVLIDRELIPVFISALMVLPVIHGNVREGVLSSDVKLLEMAKIFGFTKRQKLSKIYMPSVAPYLFAGIKTCLGLAWKAGVAAEVLCLASYSIGKNLYQSKVYLETADMFAWTFVVIVMSMIIEKLMMAAVDAWTVKRRYDKNRKSV